MLVNMQKKSLSLNKCSMNENISDWIEQDIIVPDSKPDAVKIVNVIVTPYITDCEVMDGKVKVIGNLNYFVIYRVNDGNYANRGLFMSYPYSEILTVENAKSGMNMMVEPRCRNVIFSLPNERKIAIKSEIMFKMRVREVVDVDVIKNFDCDMPIECKMCNKTFNNIMQNKSSVIASREDVMLPKEAEDFFEILKVETKIKNTEFKESYNKIMVKGDIEVKIIYLAENAAEDVKRVITLVPFSAMVELGNISDKSKFDIKYMMQDFNIKLNPDITTTKTLSVQFQINVDVTMYEEDEVEYVEDFYCQNRELTYEEEAVEAVSKTVTFDNHIDIKETITNILPANANLLDYSLDTSYITPKIVNNMVELEGNAKVSLLLQDRETMELENKVIDVLINQKYDVDGISEISNAYVEITGDTIEVTQNGTDIEVKITLQIYTNIEDMTNLSSINGIEDNILDISDLDSINIYVVKAGDTLWNIAKKYKTSIDKLVKTNDIQNPNSISVGQKILIIR
ncbi:MAG: DUF3794 domain-containing protein [Clostridia bacterium]|nr:DUF3794 domain-containing protein [Clostridia bacterium]